MTQITSENRPKCQKCEEKFAIMLYEGIWLCGECLNNHMEKIRKLNQTFILEE